MSLQSTGKAVTVITNRMMSWKNRAYLGMAEKKGQILLSSVIHLGSQGDFTNSFSQSL